MISLRAALLEDATMVFPWRNDQRTRQHLIHREPLDYSAHLKWFKKSLKMRKRHLLIAMSGPSEVGVLQFDLGKNSAEVGIYVDPQRVGVGYGKEILIEGINWLKKYFPSVLILHARVLPENIASKKIFNYAGFDLSHYVYSLATG